MTLEKRYRRAKEALLRDKSICCDNRELFERFFAFEERKLKRSNQLAQLDNGCYKTLLGFVGRFRNVNRWFGNRPWNDLTKSDVQRIYDDLEEGRILTAKGTPFKDRLSYYNKVFKSKPFALAGKADLAREVIEFYRPERREVRFVVEESFRRLLVTIKNPRHQLLFWLAWDIGENIGSLLELTRKEFTRHVNPDTGEPEYLIHLPQKILKRSRRTRTEPTLYPETVRLCDMLLPGLQDHEPLFRFGHRQALKLLQQAAKRTGATCEPHHDTPTWKDLRSGMACHLLKSGWSRDEVNARLGHTPNSDTLNAYINYLALDRHKPKQKLEQTRIEELRNELEQVQQREKLYAQRFERQREDNDRLSQQVQQMATLLQGLRDDLTGQSARR